MNDPLAAAGTTPATETPAVDANVLVFQIPNTETQMQINIADVPGNIRMDFLKKGLRDYVANSVNQANVRLTKDLAPWTAHEEATKADPLQTAVPAPTGEKPTADLIAVATAARERLYKGEVRKQGEGTGKSRERKDPFVKMVTDAVVRELFEKRKTEKGFTYPMAIKEVAGDGVAYLNAKVAEKVAAGADKATLDKFMEERYLKPARMMLGQSDNKATKDQSLL